YLAHVTVERGLSANTVGAYRRDLERYCAFLDSRGVCSVADARKSDIAAFAEAVGTGEDGRAALSPSSASRTIVAVRGFHRFALMEQWVVSDVSAEVKPRAIPKRLPKAISTAQVASILEAATTGDG